MKDFRATQLGRRKERKEERREGFFAAHLAYFG